MIYNRLTMLRVERRLSRKEVAAAVEVNPQTIGYLERGEYSPSLELALKLAALFHLSVEHIFSLTEFEPLALQLRRAQGG